MRRKGGSINEFCIRYENELTRIEVDESNAKAELSALIRMNGALSLSNQQFVINVQTENATTARRIYSLIKRIFNVEVEILVRKNEIKRIISTFVELKYVLKKYLMN